MLVPCNGEGSGVISITAVPCADLHTVAIGALPCAVFSGDGPDDNEG